MVPPIDKLIAAQCRLASDYEACVDCCDEPIVGDPTSRKEYLQQLELRRDYMVAEQAKLLRRIGRDLRLKST